MNPARWMLARTPLVRHAVEYDRHIFLEDMQDADGRFYRIEFNCAAEGNDAKAYCRHNPWPGPSPDYRKSHLSNDGFICVGPDVSPQFSPYRLDFVVVQALAWINGYSYFREHGYAATVRVFPVWAG